MHAEQTICGTDKVLLESLSFTSTCMISQFSIHPRSTLPQIMHADEILRIDYAVMTNKYEHVLQGTRSLLKMGAGLQQTFYSVNFRRSTP